MGGSRAAAVVPVVKRARGYRLYDQQGRRYLDLYRDDGGALLGHRSGSTVTLMKSVLSQGLAGALPSVWEARLLTMIAAMFPAHRNVRLYFSRSRALEAVSCFEGMRVGPSDIYDPAIHAEPRGQPRASLWRPFLPDGAPAPAAHSALLPVLPLTVCEAPAPVCFPEGPLVGLSDSDRLPGFVLAGAFTALAQLRSGRTNAFEADPAVQKALDASRGWGRTGPYVRATFSADEYPRVHGEFLRAGVLLCPWYPGPSILPGECSPGEARLLAKLFTSIPGG